MIYLRIYLAADQALLLLSSSYSTLYLLVMSAQSLATVGLETLSPRHFEALQQAFWTIFSTDLATETFAQVVDGRPTRDVYRDYFNGIRKSFQNNIHPSNAALEAVGSCRRNLNLDNTQISAKVV